MAEEAVLALEGRGTRDEGRGTRDEGRGTRDEGRGTREVLGLPRSLAEQIRVQFTLVLDPRPTTQMEAIKSLPLFRWMEAIHLVDPLPMDWSSEAKLGRAAFNSEERRRGHAKTPKLRQIPHLDKAPNAVSLCVWFCLIECHLLDFDPKPRWRHAIS
jgi:hypothetical protein